MENLFSGNSKKSNNVSLAAKWAPSEKSNKWPGLAKKIMKELGMSPKQYRKLLSKLRAELKVVETQMCSNKWSEITFAHVPSYAMKNYRKAFAKHDKVRWDAYLESVEKGESKVNAATLYPHDLVRQVYGGKKDKLIDLQWRALPNYMLENKERVLPVCDVSGSMSGLPMEVCVALGLYISERNQGIFKDAFITFSGNPTLQYVKGKTLSERVTCLSSAEWGMNTDLEKVFQVVLDRAVKHHVSSEEMPTMILIMSDMQFDQAVESPTSTLMDVIRQQYQAAGYSLPKIVFWNLASKIGVPVKFDEQGTALVSGFSPSLLTGLLSGKGISPEAVMRTIIDMPRYAAVSV